MKDLIILKLGGSILSFKDKNRCIFRSKVAKRIIKEILQARLKQKFNLIIIHGTGSFGHMPASKYNLINGYRGKKSLVGFTKSKRSGFLLNSHLWKEMEDQKLNGVTVQTFAIVKASAGEIASMDIKTIKDLLLLGIVPVLFGDEVLDDRMGFSICSSDQLAAYLSAQLQPQRLLFATDVDGVYKDNPKINNKALKISSINKESLKIILSRLKQHNKDDVSGEMKGKLEAIYNYDHSPETEIRIFNGLKKDQVGKAIIGGEIGTRIYT